MIKLKGVDTIYEGERIPAIRNINLKVREGEFLAVVGPNGAGKTTLLETINGLLASTKGLVSVLGRDVKRFGVEIRKEIGYVPQDFSVDSLTPFLVKDVVLMARFGKIGLLKSPSLEDHQKVRETLNFMKISDLAKRPIGKLSGGQLQKIMIARALAKEPKILLLDEPFSNLDLKSRSQILDKIHLLNEEKGLTILMVMHGLFSMLAGYERVVMMNEGEIVMDDVARQVLKLRSF